MKNIYDEDFVYTPSFATDLKKRFDDMEKARKAKLRAELKRSEEIVEEAERVVAKTKIKGKAA